jgi:hypothetical protein
LFTDLHDCCFFSGTLFTNLPSAAIFAGSVFINLLNAVMFVGRRCFLTLLLRLCLCDLLFTWLPAVAICAEDVLLTDIPGCSLFAGTCSLLSFLLRLSVNVILNVPLIRFQILEDRFGFLLVYYLM